MVHIASMNMLLKAAPRIYEVGVNGFTLLISQLALTVKLFIPCPLDSSVHP